MRMKEKILAIVSIPLICGIAFATLVGFYVAEVDKLADRESTIRQRIELNSAITRSTLQGASLGVLYARHKDPAIKKLILERKAAAQHQLAELERYCQGSADQKNLYRTINESWQKYLTRGDQLLAQIDSGAPLTPLEIMQGRNEVSELAAHTRKDGWALRQLLLNELKVEASHLAKQRPILRTILLIGLAGSILVCLILAVVLGKEISQRIDQLGETVSRIGSETELGPLVSGADEIADLDMAFRSMADTLNEAKRKERAIVANAVDAIFALSTDLQLLSATPATRVLLNRHEPTIVGTDVMLTIDPDDHKLTRDKLSLCAREQVEVEFENRLCPTDGRVSFLLWTARWSAAQTQIICVVRDITLRKMQEELLRANEERLQLIIKKMPVALVVTTEQGDITLLNAKSAQLFKIDNNVSEKHAIEDSLSIDSTGPASAEQLRSSAGQAILAGTVRRNGQDAHVEFFVEQLTSADGSISFLLALIDVTERQELAKLRTALMEEVVGSVDLPLAKVVESMTALQSHPLGTKQIRSAGRESERLRRLFQDLPRIEAQDSPHLKHEIEDISLLELLRTSLDSMSSQAAKNGIRLDLATEEGSVPAELTVKANDDRLMQVFVNILSNAIKFSPPNSKILVRVLNKGDEVEVQFIDQGRGIPEGMEEKIFQAYQQTKATDAIAKGGTGLGLSICKNIIESFGGTMGAKNNADTIGATFRVTIPTS